MATCILISEGDSTQARSDLERKTQIMRKEEGACLTSQISKITETITFR